MMIAYRKTNGRAHDIRFVGEDYVAVDGDILLKGDTLPSVSDLSDPPTLEQLQAMARASLENAVQAYLDGKAREHGYDDIKSAISYRGDKNATWASEGQKFFEWRSDVWTACIAIQADIQSGSREIPTEIELLAEIPALAL